MRPASAIPFLIFVVIFGIGLAIALVMPEPGRYVVGIVAFIIAAIAALATNIANQWQRAIVLRLGRYTAMRGPGIFFIIPIIDTIPYWIDIRVITSSFKAEKTLTKDTVPVDVDAVLFWKVVDPQKAALDVADYQAAISWAAQTALRDVIGKTMLADMLEGRDRISAALQKIIDQRTEPWGINVISVEVKDVLIPAGSRTPCRCRRRPSASARRASSSAIPSGRSPRSSRRRQFPTRTTRRRCTCAR